MKIHNKLTILFSIVSLFIAGISIFLIKIEINMVVLLSILIISACVIGYYAARIFSRPIDRLKEGAGIISSGNLDYKVETKSNDEIGDISKAVDSLVDDVCRENLLINDLRRNDSKQKQKIEELHGKEKHFRGLFEHSNDAVFIYDVDCNIIDVNNRACEMLGYTKKELLNTCFIDLHSEAELTKSKMAYKEGEETSSIRFESRFKKCDGSEIDVEISSSCVDLKGGIMQGIVSNITERKEMEDALRESEEKFRTFMETASDLMYITDENGVFSYVNGAMVSVLGYSREELVRMHLTYLLDEKSKEESVERRQELLAEGENVHELVWETKSRKKVYGEMKTVGIFDDNGVFKGVRGIFRDITERKKIEKAQRLTQLGKLAADVAHEVNNPITIITARAQLSLMDANIKKEIKKNLDIIVDQCEQARDIVKRLLMFSKPSKGDFKKAKINGAIDATADLVEHQFTKLKVKIIKNLAPSIPEIFINEKQMQEVFMNLLHNAAEAMTEGGTITIKTSKNKNFVKVEFSDTGDGILEKDMKKIFDPFFTTKETGTGLGISVCYGILRSHGGNLDYKSKPGEGTTAIVLLPISDEPPNGNIDGSEQGD